MCMLMFTKPVKGTHLHMHGYNTCKKSMHTLRKKCICTRACAPMQRCRSFVAMKAIANLFWVLREHRTGSRLPPALLPARRNESPDAVRSKNPSKSTLAHDEVAAAVSHKHHSIIRVGAGLIQFVYGSHSRLAADLTLDKVLFSPWYSWAFQHTTKHITKHFCNIPSTNSTSAACTAHT